MLFPDEDEISYGLKAILKKIHSLRLEYSLQL